MGGLSPVSGGTATLAPGLVCDGASGVCGSWTGPGTCCQLDDATRGIHTCVSGNDPTGSNCNLLEIFQPTSFSATPHFGETCVKEPARNGYMCQGLP